jgi:hypothetical protein
VAAADWCAADPTRKQNPGRRAILSRAVVAPLLNDLWTRLDEPTLVRQGTRPGAL